MGKKQKVGKQRKDRFYQLAKETGYRSRASFKLIQLNRKFEFLQKSKVTIDLCAAPGGWLQVCQKYMPVSSVIIGVDLVGIKPIPNVITLQEDITTVNCRKAIEKEIKTWKADLVLNDGAPNVGKNWFHDAFGQARLTLSALQLATDFLMKGGTFVTKVFRSKDYNALMWVLGKLFKKVSATKPQASRNESAEIFVVCQGYYAPDKIDPKFFDTSFLFEETTAVVDERKIKAKLLQPISKQKKAKAEGYRDGDLTCFTSVKASDFIQKKNHIELLSQASEIIIDTNDIAKHPLTTDEMKECIKDIKVLGRKELLTIIAWRRKLKEELYKPEKKSVETNGEVPADTEPDVEEVDDEEEVDNTLKRKKKKILKERRKLNERMNLKMVIKGDQLVEDDQELFKLSLLTNKFQLKNFEEFSMSEGSDNEHELDVRPTRETYDRDDRDHLMVSDDEEEKEDIISQNVNDSENDSVKDDEDIVSEDDEDNGLLTDLGTSLSRDEKRSLFFKKGIFEEENVNDESDDEVAFGLNEKKTNLKQKEKASSGSEDDSDRDSSDEDSLDEEEPVKKRHSKCQLDVKLDAESLALGEQLIKSRKAKRDLADEGWNRYTRGDEALPSWFRQDEEKHYRKPVNVDSSLVAEYKDRMKGINARPIKKVAEAKARKKKRGLMRLDKTKKRAEAITGASDMTEKEKASHLRTLYKKALKGNKKKEVTYVVAKKGKANQRPKGLKGKYKVVDGRLKKDTRATKRLEKKRGKKPGSTQAGRGKVKSKKTQMGRR